ncbi:MAG: TlpA disulfide reductase family protein [Gammaproteobacteria bacterium]|nr:TlpA disulfide reductase family protein [Gammaproteobacteria bacterium]
MFASDYEPSNEFVIYGWYEHVEYQSEKDESSTTKGANKTDLSSATIEITYDVTNELGELETVVLTSGSFVDRRVELRGTVDTKTKARIAIKGATEENLSTTVVLDPRGYAHYLSVVDHEDPQISDYLILKARSTQSLDSAKRFLVFGMFDGYPEDFKSAILDIRGTVFDDSTMDTLNLGAVMIDDARRRCSIDGDIDEPHAVTIYLDTGKEYLSTPAVIEPGSEVTVRWDRSKKLLIAHSDSNRHKILVESWQQSEEYLEKAGEVIAAQADTTLKPQSGTAADLVMGKMKGGDSASESLKTNDVEAKSADSNISRTEESTQQTTITTNANTPRPAVGCEHVSVDDVQISIRDLIRANTMLTQAGRLRQEQIQRKKVALQDLAKNAEDPLNALLAMELGAYGINDTNRDEAFLVFDKLASVLDSDLVVRRVEPRREHFARNIAIEANENSLVQGQKVPDFKLTDLEGTDVSLYSDVLKENELVLIDFWASWCTPCIAVFYHLKSIYADYNEKGFEIVSVSLDSEVLDWRESSEEQKFPWINLGEIGGMKGPTAVNYGVQFMPKNFLVDENGCILKKDLHPELLKESLGAILQTDSP